MDTIVSVAIVEDEKESALRLKDNIDKYAESSEISIKTVFFGNGDSFLSSKEKFDVVFMDIEMPGNNGLDVVRILRKREPDMLVLFCTNFARYAVNGYEVAAFDFMVKPVTYFDFKIKFDRVVECLNRRKKKEIWVASRHGKKLINEKSLKYVEVMRHTLVFHTLEGDITGTGTLKSVAKIFTPPSFAFCNQCFLVNLAFVGEIDGDAVVVGGDKLTISSPKKKEFVRALNTYFACGGGK